MDAVGIFSWESGTRKFAYKLTSKVIFTDHTRDYGQKKSFF
jgi:hypothetical protein